MPLTKRSKVKEAWRHPIGHDLLLNMLRQTGRSERWLEGPVVSNMPLQRLDRFAGPGFCDMLVEMAAHEPERFSHIEDDHKAWWKEAVVYQVYPPAFMDSDHDGVGDIGGIIQRLPCLEQLGVNALWLWPVLDEGPGSRGARSFTDIKEELGTMEDFRRLAEQLHARDMRLVIGLDIAYTSSEHPWFSSSVQGGDNGYYTLRAGTPDAPPNNWMRGGDDVWTWYPGIKSWGLHLGGHHQMDLNWDSPAVRAEMQKVLNFWLENGADGFMLGPVNRLSKSSWENGSAAAQNAIGVVGYEKFTYGPRLHRYLQELRRGLPHTVFLAGEAHGVGTEMAKFFTGGSGGAELDMLLDSSHLLPKARLRSEEGYIELAELKNHYIKWMECYGSSHWMPLFFEGPDCPRIVSRVGASPLYRAILAKMLATMLMTLRGTPVVYQGGELGLSNTRFTSLEDLRAPESLQMYAELCSYTNEREAFQRVVAACADQARTPMPWSAGPGSGFSGALPWMRLPDGADYLNVNAQMDDKFSVWNFYRRLIALRRRSAALVYGSFNPVFVKNRRVFCYFRILDGEKWYVEINLTEREAARPGRIQNSQKLALSNYETPSRALRPYEANIYRCE